MTSHEDLRQLLDDGSEAIVEAWYGALRPSAVAFRSPSEVRSHLSDIWDEVAAFLLRDDGLPLDAEPIGARFVPLRLRPQAVGRIAQVLLALLMEDLPRDVERTFQARLPNLIEGLLTGLIRASERSLLEQQEEIREAYARSLRQAEEQLRIKDAGIESSINAIAMLDTEGGITYVNPAFLEMWGYQGEGEVLGRHVSHFGEWQGDVERAQEILSERGGWVGELVATRKDDSRFDVQVSVSPVHVVAGRFTQLMAFFVDITERKRTQEALRQRAVQAAFLNEIGEEIAGQRTAQGVLDRAVHLAQETFDLHQVAVLLLDQEQQRLDVVAVASPADDLPRDLGSLSVGEGITGWVAQQNQTLIVNDVRDDPRYVRLSPKSKRTRSELAVPIRTADRVVGVLDVQSPTCGAFGGSERVVLETLADQIAVALENARLYQVLQEELTRRWKAERALRKSVQRLEMVHDIDQAILGAKSTDEIAEAVVHHLQCLVPCQRVSICLFDWESDQVTVLAAIQTIGECRAAKGASFPITEREWVLDLWENGELADVRDARELPLSSPLIRTVVEDGIKSFLSVPIGFRDELIGLLTLGSDQFDGFEPKHGPIVMELADTLSIAIQQTRLFDSLRRHRERLRGTMARLAAVEEMERRRVVRDLHDRVGQNLTALDLNLSLARSRLEERGLRHLASQLDDALSLVAQTNETTRQLMVDLRPPVLDDYGLLSALHWYADQFSARTGIDIVVQGREESTDELPSHVENALFRITQEALNNITKHAQAGEVRIALAVEGDAIRLTISDDGVGFAPEDVESERSSWGLLTMRERAESVGAQCRFESTPGEGTRVLVDAPI
jgi:PAS domain S-box-containing protein